MWYLINYQQPDVNKIYLYIKDKFESKYRLLIKRREKTDIEIKNVKHPKAFFFLIIHKQLTMSMKILKTIIQQIKEKC